VNFSVNDQFSAGFDRVARFTVTGINDAPVATDATAGTTQDAPVTVAFNADDAVGEDTPATLAYTLSPGPAGTSLSVEGANLTFHPGTAFASLNEGETADVAVTYSATDARGLSSGNATVTITITGVNDAPVVESTSQIISAANGETSASVTLSATDADTENADPSSFIFHVAADGHDFIDNLEGATKLVGASTMLSYAGNYESLADGEIGEQVFDFVAVDLRGAISNTGSVTLKVTGVNDAPVFANGSDFDGLLDHAGGDSELAATSDAGQVLGFDPDSGDQLLLRFRLGGSAESPLLSLAGDYGDLAIDAQTGAWQYTLFAIPDFGGVPAGEVVFEEFDISVDDSLGLSATEVLSVAIIV
jgi:VCBS repeat-containing protein